MALVETVAWAESLGLAALEEAMIQVSSVPNRVVLGALVVLGAMEAVVAVDAVERVMASLFLAKAPRTSPA